MAILRTRIPELFTLMVLKVELQLSTYQYQTAGTHISPDEVSFTTHPSVYLACRAFFRVDPPTFRSALQPPHPRAACAAAQSKPCHRNCMRTPHEVEFTPSPLHESSLLKVSATSDDALFLYIPRPPLMHPSCSRCTSSPLTPALILLQASEWLPTAFG